MLFRSWPHTHPLSASATDCCPVGLLGLCSHCAGTAWMPPLEVRPSSVAPDPARHSVTLSPNPPWPHRRALGLGTHAPAGLNPRDVHVIARCGLSFIAYPGEQSGVLSPNSTGGLTPWSKISFIMTLIPYRRAPSS